MSLLQQLSDFEFPISLCDCPSFSSTEGLDLVAVNARNSPKASFWDAGAGVAAAEGACPDLLRDCSCGCEKSLLARPGEGVGRTVRSPLRGIDVK